MYKARNGQVGKYAPQWRDAIWLGKRWGTGEYVVIGEHGLVAAQSIQRRPIEERWRNDLIQAITVLPWGYKNPGSEEELEERDQEERDQIGGEPEHEQHEVVPRSFRIMPRDLEKFGYTTNG